VNGFRMGASNQGLRATALVAWPLITAVPAFAVSLIVATILFRTTAHVSRQSRTSQDS